MKTKTKRRKRTRKRTPSIYQPPTQPPSKTPRNDEEVIEYIKSIIKNPPIYLVAKVLKEKGIKTTADLDEEVFMGHLEEFVYEDNENPYFYEKLIEWLRRKGYEISKENDDLIQWIPLEVIKKHLYSIPLEEILEDTTLTHALWDNIKNEYIEKYILEHAKNPKQVIRQLLKEEIIKPHDFEKAEQVFEEDKKQVEKKIEEKIERGELPWYTMNYVKHELDLNPYKVAEEYNITIE